MGVCSSCLGGRDSSDEAERARLLDSDPYAPSHHHTSYGAWSQPPIAQPHTLSPEDAKREQEAMHNIMRWASDQIVEIFPVAQRTTEQTQITNNTSSSSLSHSTGDDSHDDEVDDGERHQRATQNLHHQDILMSMIPGDKSKRSIRIYPASRPVSSDAQSVRSKASQTRMNGSVRGKGKQNGSGVFVKLNVDFP